MSARRITKPSVSKDANVTRSPIREEHFPMTEGPGDFEELVMEHTGAKTTLVAVQDLELDVGRQHFDHQRHYQLAVECGCGTRNVQRTGGEMCLLS